MNSIVPQLVYFSPDNKYFSFKPPTFSPQVLSNINPIPPGLNPFNQLQNIPNQPKYNSFSLHVNIPPPPIPIRTDAQKMEEKTTPRLLKNIQTHEEVINARISSLKHKKISLIEKTELEAPLRHLNRILKGQAENSATNRLFNLVKTYKEISVENYLPWRTEFVKDERPYYLDGIVTQYLTKPVMWSIDPWERPFVTFIYCYGRQESRQILKRQSFTLIQRYVDSGDYLFGGSEKKKLKLDTTNPDTLFNDLEKLLQYHYIYRKHFNKGLQKDVDLQICLLSNIRNRDLFMCADRSKYKIENDLKAVLNNIRNKDLFRSEEWNNLCSL